MKIQRDSLTGLPQRRDYLYLVNERLTQKQAGFCMLTMKIDHFNYLGKWYGRAEEERLLADIAAFFQELINKYEIITGYMEPDTFSVFFPADLAMAENIRHSTTQIVKNARDSEVFRPIFGGFILRDNFSAGAADLFEYTINAINQAVGSLKTNIFWFDEGLARQMLEETELMPKVAYGMENGQFTFYLQPRCQMSDGRIIGAEALVRWLSSTGEIIRPEEFIPAMEKNGYITQLDKYIWEKVCQVLQRWQKRGMRMLPVSVNVSRRDIQEMDVVQVFAQLLDKYNIPVDFLELEITESAYIHNEASIRETEQGLRRLGFKILIDDFGSGYSSLNMLKDIQADVLKLDMRFLDMSRENFDKGCNIINSIISMASQIDLAVIAEGVETLEQSEMLSALGCSFAQGYHYYRPMPIAEYELLLEDENNVALSGITNRKSGAAYLRDLAQYFAMVAEVNPFTGEYHFIQCDDGFRFSSGVRPDTINEYIESSIESGNVHPDDAAGYLRRTGMAFIREKLLSRTLRILYDLRIKRQNSYQWYTFECMQPKNFSLEEPWILFTWKQAHADASRRIDSLTLMHRMFVLVLKVNARNGNFEILHRDRAAGLDIYRNSVSAAELAANFKSHYIYPDDRKAYEAFTDRQAVLRHFGAGDEPMRMKLRYLRRDKYVLCRLEISRSIEYSGGRPVVLVTLMDCHAL